MPDGTELHEFTAWRHNSIIAVKCAQFFQDRLFKPAAGDVAQFQLECVGCWSRSYWFLALAIGFAISLAQLRELLHQRS